MTEVLGNSAAIARGRPFAKGNPGRPKGVRHRSTLVCEKLMRDDAKEIVQAVIVAAKAGDMVAAKIVLDRISPARKGRPIHFELPEARSVDDVAAALAAVVRAMADGELTPDEAALVASVLEMRRKSIETIELENRLRTLEMKAGTMATTWGRADEPF
jgi:hypothetical protein